MSTVSESLRRRVTRRAKNRCEYCVLPARGQVGRFPIDHVNPRTAGGATIFENLALACHHCNARKWMYTDGIDPVTGVKERLFNPRAQHWAAHFEWSKDDPATLVGKTACGRATVERLQLNHPDMLALRRLLIMLDVFQ